VKIGDPGAHNEFNGAVYERGAMTLQALRTRIGDTAFFTVLRTWAADHQYGNGAIPEFIELAETVSGEDLASFFTNWLYTGRRPAPTGANGFPADFDPTPGPVARGAVPASWQKIQRTNALLAEAERR
jgi:hypothetical protein